MTASQLSKSERIDVRASSAEKQLLQEAARASHKNVSEFLLDAGVSAAIQALADRRQFALDDDAWRALQAALDWPVQHKPRLEKLLNEPGVLDELALLDGSRACRGLENHTGVALAELSAGEFVVASQEPFELYA